MKESGIGRENGLEALDACMWRLACYCPSKQSSLLDSQSKSTIVNIASPEDTRMAIDWFAEDDASEKRYG